MDTIDQSETNQQSQNASPASPRRRKPPIDLDAALYLQSQASYVQEPNITTSPTQLTKGVSATRLSPQQQTSVSPVSGNHPQASNSTTSISPAREIVGHRLASVDYSSHGLGHAFFDGHYSSQGHINNNYNDNNISVDYIDCLSNTDLLLQMSRLQHQQQSSTTMRGIPHCRKHFRFYRNRVEPFEDRQPETPDKPGTSSVDTQTPVQTSKTSNPLADQPIVAELDATTATTNTTTTTGDASSNIISSANGLDDDPMIGANHRIAGHESDRINRFLGSKTSSSGVLYPISVSEVKKRTHFIGQLSQDSLLSHDELYRYFPNGRVSIFVCTWNQNRKRPPMNLNDLLLPDQIVNMPDIYAIGIQEAFSSQSEYLREWEIELQTNLGPSHVLLHSCSLGILHLSLFVRRDLIWFCSTPEESIYNSRSIPTNMIKTKGAISIAFRFFGTSFMFTNCHFPAHENKLKDRVEEYQRIISSIDLPKNLKLLKPRYLSNDSTARFDCVFFMGDLNFRLEQRTFDETIQILEDIFHQKDPSYEVLTQHDELLKVMESNQAFHGFDESPIKFPPTYKFLAKTNKYDRQTKRVPSYTDRILYRSKRQRHIQCLIYDWLPQLISSDHKPVYCLFDVLIRPGHEQNMVSSLNAGLFQRNIYLEALKRRAENPDSMNENDASGSLICSVS